VIADPLQSDVAGGQVIRFRPRKGGSRVSRGGKNLIGNADQDHSPVPDLSRYQGKESSDEYRHRMMVNAVAFHTRVMWLRLPSDAPAATGHAAQSHLMLMEIPSGGADRISSVHKITQFKGLNARRATWFAGPFFVCNRAKETPARGRGLRLKRL